MVFVRGTDDSGILENTEKIAKPYGFSGPNSSRMLISITEGFQPSQNIIEKQWVYRFFFHHSDIIFF